MCALCITKTIQGRTTVTTAVGCNHTPGHGWNSRVVQHFHSGTKRKDQAVPWPSKCKWRNNMTSTQRTHCKCKQKQNSTTAETILNILGWSGNDRWYNNERHMHHNTRRITKTSTTNYIATIWVLKKQGY